MQFTTLIAGKKMGLKLLSIKQRYKLNAIHNKLPKMLIKTKTVVNKAKIQIECNSQLLMIHLNYLQYCCQ